MRGCTVSRFCDKLYNLKQVICFVEFLGPHPLVNSLNSSVEASSLGKYFVTACILMCKILAALHLYEDILGYFDHLHLFLLHQL